MGTLSCSTVVIGLIMLREDTRTYPSSLKPSSVRSKARGTWRGTYPFSGVYGEHSYFWISNNHIMSQQKGVFRVNCIDSLDRTNVVEVCSALCKL